MLAVVPASDKGVVLLLPNRLQKLRPLVTGARHAIILRNGERLAAGRGREGFDGAVGLTGFQPLLLCCLELGGDVGQLRRVLAIQRLQALVQVFVVFAQQVFGRGLAEGGAFQGLDVVFDFVAGVVVGFFRCVYAGRNQCQCQDDRFHVCRRPFSNKASSEAF